jgi:predicted enzyme related to lactoylglutathione lyase
LPEITKHEPGTPSWADVSSPDIEAAVSFYEQLFGWEASEPGDPEETGGYRMFTRGGKAVAGAGPTRSEEQPPAWMTYVTVADAEAAAERAKAAGGAVVVEPMDVMTAGRMAVLADPAGAVFAVWQPREHIGAELVNEPGSMTWNELRTRDTEGAKRFYGELFGWDGMAYSEMEAYTVWTLGGNAPENGKGGMIDMDGTEMPAEVPPHWDVTFAVEDADQTAERAKELGGNVVFGPMDIAVGRMAGIQDPTGAMFSVIKLAQQPG